MVIISPYWAVAYLSLSSAGCGVAERGGSAGSHSDWETTSDHQGAPRCPPGPNTTATIPSGCSMHPTGVLRHRIVPHAQTPSLSRYMACLNLELYWQTQPQCLKSVLLFAPLQAMLVGHVTLRLLKPECDLDEAWEQEDLDTAAHRTILLLHNHTVPQREAKTGGEQTRLLYWIMCQSSR